VRPLKEMKIGAVTANPHPKAPTSRAS
jgi:hypothetical protein